ncbi:MAG: hypothetical protein ACOX6O_09990 [Christensenellales bacterium]|jgi:hypothetical protein
MVYCQMKKFFVLFMAIVLTVSILGGCFVSPVQVQAEEALAVEEPTAEAAPVIEELTAEAPPAVDEPALKEPEVKKEDPPAVEEPTAEEPPAVDEPALKEPEVKKEDPPAVEESTVEEAEEEPKVEESAAEEPKAATVLVRYYGADEKLIREDKVVIGQAPPLPPLAPTVEGQVFVHWYLVNDKLSGNSSLKYDFNLPVRGGINLRALYVASTPAAEESVKEEPKAETEETPVVDDPAVKEPVEEAGEATAVDDPTAEEPEVKTEEAPMVDDPAVEESEEEAEEVPAADVPVVEEPVEEAEETPADDVPVEEEPVEETEEAPVVDDPAVKESEEEAEEAPAADEPATEEPEEEAGEAAATDDPAAEEPKEEAEEAPAADVPAAEEHEEEAKEVPAEEALVRLSVALAVEGEEAQDGAYQALLTGGNLPEEGIAVANAGDQFIFPELAFTAQDAGTHVFLVQALVQESLPLHSYDLRAQEIRVEVLADENGHVTALVSYPLEADYLLIAHSVQTRVPTARVHANLQPGQIINYGDEVVFSAEINDCGQSPRIQWQYSPDNENWTDIAGGNDVTLSVQITPSNASGYWRVIVTMGD